MSHHHCGIANNANGIGLFDLYDELLRMILFDWCTLPDLKNLHSAWFVVLKGERILSKAGFVVSQSWKMRTRRGTFNAASSRAWLQLFATLLSDPNTPYVIDLGSLTYNQSFQCWCWMGYRGMHINKLKYVHGHTTIANSNSSQYRHIGTLAITSPPETTVERDDLTNFIRACLTLRNVNLCHCSSSWNASYHADIIAALPPTVEWFSINTLSGYMLRTAVATIPNLLGLAAKATRCFPIDILAITSFNNLRHLALRGLAINSIDAQNAVVAVLTALGNQLKSFELDHADGVFMNDRVVDAITQNCTQLETVRLMVKHITNASMKGLVTKLHETLTHVSLDGGIDEFRYGYNVFASISKISDDSIALLIEACCRTLATLALRNMPDITDKAFATTYGQPTLGTLKSLILVNLRNISSATLETLASNGCRSLEELELSSLPTVTDEGIQHLLCANLHLTKIKLENLPEVTHQTIQTVLDPDGLTMFTPAEGRPALITPTPGRAKLLTLILVHINHVNELETYAVQLSKLSTLILKEICTVTDSALRALALHCHSLTRLEFMSMNDIADDGIETLVSANPMLRKVSFISVPNMSDRSVQALADHCPRIARASFTACINIKSAQLMNRLVRQSQIQFFDDLNINDCHYSLTPLNERVVNDLFNSFREKLSDLQDRSYEPENSDWEVYH